MILVRIMEMGAVEAFMAKHSSRLYMSRNAPEVTTQFGVPKLLLVTANSFLGTV